MIIVIIFLSIVAALITQELHLRYKFFGPARASSMVSLIAGLIIYFLKIDPVYGVVIMGASFAAMSTDKVVPSRCWMIVCGFVFSLIFLNLTNDFFSGFGGKLGTTACMSVVITLGLMKLAGGCRKYNLLQCNKKRKYLNNTKC